MKQMFSKEELQAVSKEVADTEIDENLIANPTLEGNEETLSSIGIKGTNYAVGGGSEVHLYKHHIKIGGYNQNYDNFTLNVSFDIYLSTDTALTFENVKSWLSQNGYNEADNQLAVVSKESSSPAVNVDKHIIIGIYGTSSWIFSILQYTEGTNSGNLITTFFQTGQTCTDTITQIF